MTFGMMVRAYPRWFFDVDWTDPGGQLLGEMYEDAEWGSSEKYQANVNAVAQEFAEAGRLLWYSLVNWYVPEREQLGKRDIDRLIKTGIPLENIVDVEKWPFPE